ncbi:MAG: hypothetical protein QOG35_1234, partial [Solirubrobacteraceae bacterium]|nr:hypothetical protein [Solirubrobacteraceae bacterium]
MTKLRRSLLTIAAAGFAAGLVAIVLVLSSDWQRSDRAMNLALGPLVGWA